MLLAVLVTMLICGLALTGLARRSLRLATSAVERQRDLQWRWGATSCQRALLPLAQHVFEPDEEDEAAAARPPRRALSPPPAEIHRNVTLGGMRFELVLADEDAKVNLNMVYHVEGSAPLQQELMRRRPRLFPARVRPECPRQDLVKATETDDPLPPAFRGWGQVFDFALARNPADTRWRLAEATSGMTLWGSGRLNVSRATDDALHQVLGMVVTDSEARQIVRKLREQPKLKVRGLIAQADVPGADGLLLEQLLSDQSACYSIWIGASSVSSRWQQFVAAERDPGGLVRTVHFSP